MDILQPAQDALKQKTILVTGAADGIGQSVAMAYAAHGATVILLDRNVPKLEQVYDSIEKAGYPQPAIYPLDLEGAVAKDYTELAAVIAENFGQLDGLLHNAAVLGSLTPIELYNPSLWHGVMQVNVNSVFLLTQACLPVMKQASAASLVMTFDQNNTQSWAYWGAYAASKHALTGVFASLKVELEKSVIRINAVNPGKVNTVLRRAAYPGIDPHTWAQPDDITAAYVYLMSADSQHIRGTVVDAQAAITPSN